MDLGVVVTGLLVAIEGGDGAGKGKQSLLLAERLAGEGFPTKLYSYPKYEGEHGKVIKKHLDKVITLNVSDLFDEFMKDQQEDIDLISKHREAGTVVIWDRSKLSTMAYQTSQGYDYDEAKRREESSGLADPDIVFFIHVPPEIAMLRKEAQRKAEGRGMDRHEEDTLLQERVNGVYERMMAEGWGAKRWVRIDGTRSVGAIHEEIADTVRASLNIGPKRMTAL